MPVSYHGMTYNRTADASYEETAGIVWQRRRQSPGVGFARKEATPQIIRDSEKGIARTRVVEFFRGLDLGRRKQVLTMPGLFWKFERQLCSFGQSIFYAVENEPAIYRASIQYMLGFRHHDGFGMIDSCTVYSKFVHEYKYISLERYSEIVEHVFDCAWLDFNGFITESRAEAIRRIFDRTEYRFVVTLMEARQSKSMSKKIAKAGSLENYLSSIVGVPPIDVYRYCDGVPMVQISWSKG